MRLACNPDGQDLHKDNIEALLQSGKLESLGEASFIEHLFSKSTTSRSTSKFKSSATHGATTMKMSKWVSNALEQRGGALSKAFSTKNSDTKKK
jgi:hypothetical protein